MKQRYKQIIFGFIVIANLFGITGLFLLYGPYNKARELWITSAMTTFTHQYLAYTFYDAETISEVLNNNVIIETKETTNLNKIDLNKPIYKSKYDKEILVRAKNNPYYKVIDIKGKGYVGYLVAVYDPSLVSIGTASHAKAKGASLTKIAKSYNALLAINGGGFEGDVNTRRPAGDVISNNKLIFKDDQKQIANYIAFTKDHKLYLSKSSGEQLLKNDIRDAVAFGPFLIVNGKSSIIKGNGGWGISSRTAIGQRRDGVLLMLVIDGRQSHSIGASLKDVVDIMQRYGAYNAANLDGGGSTGLYANGKLVNKPSGGTTTGERNIPNAFILTKKET